MFNLGLALTAGGLLLSQVWRPAGVRLFLTAVGVWVWAVVRLGWDRWRGVPQPLARAKGISPPAAGASAPWEDDRPVALDDPEIPVKLRAAIGQDAQPGDVLWRCVRQGAPTGPLVVEWSLMSAEGELIEAYWQER